MTPYSTTVLYDDYEANTTSSTTPPPLCRDAVCVFSAVANMIIFILGVAGNGLVIWIAGFKLKKSVISTWYLSLAASDFLYCCVLPFEVISMVRNDWIFGSFVCKFSSFIMFLNMYSSILLLVIISVDRCVVVTFPVWAQNRRTVRKASVIVALVWIISAALSTPGLVFNDVKADDLTQLRTCFYNIGDQELAIETVCEFVLGFVIPFLIIIVCYVVIIRKLKTNQMAKSRKPFRIMTVLIASFLICWLPYHTFALMELNYEKYESFFLSGFEFSIILANANSCLNPLLYAFMGRDFKKQCSTVLSKIKSVVEEEEGQSTVQGTAIATSEEGRQSISK